MRKDRLTIRLTPNQMLVLKELTETLNTSYSMMVRAIIGDWLSQNEEHIYRIIDQKRAYHANNQQTREEEENYREERDGYASIETEGISEHRMAEDEGDLHA